MVELYILVVGLTITHFVEATTTSKKIPEICSCCDRCRADRVLGSDLYVCPADSF